MKLYSYFRSSAAYRVRIALNLKALPHEIIPVHLLKNGGEQFAPEYRQLNADALIPTLLDESAGALTQSLAIIEYLEEAHPVPALLPANAIDRAYVRSIALAIACDIHPLNNLRVMRYLKNSLNVGDEARDDWYRHWCQIGLEGLEARLSRDPRVGKFCYGDTPGMADCCLVPQFFNAKRLNCDLTLLPTLQRINDTCIALEAFASAAPERQPDAE